MNITDVKDYKDVNKSAGAPGPLAGMPEEPVEEDGVAQGDEEDAEGPADEDEAVTQDELEGNGKQAEGEGKMKQTAKAG